MKKRQVRNILKNEVKKDILDFLMTEDGAYFGDLVMNMDQTQINILEHLIELKKMGWIYKDKGGGRFRINEEYCSKRKIHDGTGLKGREKSIIDELNSFAEATRSKEGDADNEIAINKLAPGEQKVEQNKRKKKK